MLLQMRHRSATALLALGLVIALGRVIYTTHKLNRMARIRGITGDVAVEQHAVTGKTREPGRVVPYCFLSWRDDPRRGPEHRVEADCNYWEQVRIGDPIEIVRPDSDNEVYLRRGEIYASDGSFAVDFGLLAVELAAVGYCLFRIVRGAGRA